MGQLDGKIAVVTGGSSGIGLAVSSCYAEEGAHVIMLGRDRQRLDEAVAEVGHGAVGLTVDVSEPEQARAFFEDLERVDILVTLAGSAKFGPIDEFTPEEWSEYFRNRFFGQTTCCHYAVPKMGEGSVIVLCSGIAADTHVSDYPAGSSICGAVAGLGKSLAVDLAPRGIRVNVISPGFIGFTKIVTNLEHENLVKFVNNSVAATPLGHPGLPSNVTEAVLLLTTNDFISGQVLHVDGGWTAT